MYDNRENICVGQGMGRRVFILILTGILLGLTGCSVEKLDTEKKKNLDFTVVDADEIPQELAGEIEAEKKTPMKLTYTDKGYLYIVEGYGSQESSGYSVKVSQVYETENALYLETELIGPAHGEEVVNKETCPYVAVKLEYNEKPVVFE